MVIIRWYLWSKREIKQQMCSETMGSWQLRCQRAEMWRAALLRGAASRFQDCNGCQATRAMRLGHQCRSVNRPKPNRSLVVDRPGKNDHRGQLRVSDEFDRVTPKLTSFATIRTSSEQPWNRPRHAASSFHGRWQVVPVLKNLSPRPLHGPTRQEIAHR